MALIGENGLQSLITPPSSDNASAGREIENRSQGGGRASRADAPGPRSGADSGSSGVVLDLSPTARNVVENGSLAVRASDAAPAANDGLSALRNGASANEIGEGVQRGDDGDGDRDDRLTASGNGDSNSARVARANDRRANETAAAARAEPTAGRTGSRFDLTI